MLFWLQGTTPTLATASTCFLMVWLEVFAVAMVMVAEVSFMPRSLPERMQNEPAISQRRVVKIQLKRGTTMYTCIRQGGKKKRIFEEH